MLKAVIVDDEVAAQRSLEILLEINCPTVSVVGKAGSVAEGIELISETDPHVVFLDIEMPQASGFQLLEHFYHKRFEVVFITAYNQYAVKAFKHSAIDYLLKPVDVEELVGAVEKVSERIKNKIDPRERYTKLFESLERMIPRKLAVLSQNKTAYVDLVDAMVVKLQNSEIAITMVDGNCETYNCLREDMESQLVTKGFFAIDKGVWINLNKVLRFDKTGKGVVMLQGNISVPLKTISKDEFIAKFTEHNLGLEE